MSEDGELSDSPQDPESNDDGFVIDRSFSMVVEEESEATEAVVKDSGDSESPGPSEWQRKMRRRLLEEVDPTTATDSPPAKRRRVNLCFNCRGEHSISQCPEPKDFAAIRKNKQEFQAQNQSGGGSGAGGGRISKITDEKEARFKPGRLSQSLRDALGIGSDDIPEWIYRMRHMGFHEGYPPGYLRKSLKHEYETLKIFDDSTTKSPNKDEEDDSRPSPKVQKNLIHYYMGFNKTYASLRDRDERRFEVPPWDTFCSMLQEKVSKEHEINEKERRRDARNRRAELQKIREAAQKDSEGVDDDILVIDKKATSEDSEEGTSREEAVKTPEPGAREEIKERLGESIHQLIGTPIISRRDASGVWLAPTTPTLEQFAVGIVPFEAKEEEKPRGIFKKIMSIFKGDSKKAKE